MMTSVAILNGGRATRYGGADKGALVVNGRSILDHQIEAARAVTDDIMLVGRKDGPPAPSGNRCNSTGRPPIARISGSSTRR